MAFLPASTISPGPAAAAAHRKFFSSAPTGCAGAPATLAVIGDHTDDMGGVVVAMPADRQVAVAVSPADGDTVTVAWHRPGAGSPVVTRTSFSRLDELGEHIHNPTERAGGIAAYRSPDTGEDTRPTASPEGTAAELIGGVIWSMIGRQMITRDVAGMNVTVSTTVPENMGLGEIEAAATAAALAIGSAYRVNDDIPHRARLADLLTQTCRVFHNHPTARWRLTTALRGSDSGALVINYADNSASPLMQPGAGDILTFAVLPHHPAGAGGSSGDVAFRRDFFSAATKAFGVQSLRCLPDATQRVIDWLGAVHHVRGDKDAPSIAAAEDWIAFCQADTDRALQYAALCRSRGARSALELVNDSDRDIAARWAR
ncbi:hypothetical protein JZY06_00035, partial [Corynebacterium sp. CCM 8862]